MQNKDRAPVTRTRVTPEQSASLCDCELSQRHLRFAKVCWILIGETTRRTDLLKHGELGHGSALYVAHEHGADGAALFGSLILRHRIRLTWACKACDRSLAQRAFVADDLMRSMKQMLRRYDGLMTAWVGRTFLQDLGNWHGLLFSRHRIVGWCGHSLDRASSLEQRRLDRFLSVKKPVRS